MLQILQHLMERQMKLMPQLEATRLLYARAVAEMVDHLNDGEHDDEREDELKEEHARFEEILRSYWR